MASLKSRLPNVPLERALEGIIPGDEEEARAQVRYLVADVVAMFIIPDDAVDPLAWEEGGLVGGVSSAECELDASSGAF